MNKRLTIIIAVATMQLHIASLYAQNSSNRTPLLNASQTLSLSRSSYLSVKDAPIVTGQVWDGTRAADGASWFMTTISNEKKVKSAKWTTTALGVYELYVNGEVIGEEVLKPGFTHAFKTKRSFTYDVTKALRLQQGEQNTLAAQVTPGWWADKIVTPGGSHGMHGTKCAFRGVLELTFADGTRKLYGTNPDTWRAGIAGPVTHAAIFDGEEYDTRIPLGYLTPEKLSKPEVNHEFHGEIIPTDGAEVYMRYDLALTPVRAYIWKDVEGKDDEHHGKVIITREYNNGETIVLHKGENLVVDFGQNCAGVPEFCFKAKAGTRLTCLTSELLNDGMGAKKRGMDGPEGSIHRENLRCHNTGIRLDYTFADTEGMATFVPRATFFGYRLISVTATDDVTIQQMQSIPVTSIAKSIETGTISTGNELINRLIQNTIWGQRSNYLSVPTDCPQRNERLGWTADTQVFTETGTFFANTRNFFHKWMRDMRDTQSNKGGYPGVAPLAQYGNEMMRVGWADAGVIVPWTIWKQYADNDIVDECWESMEWFMDHVNETKYDHQALIAENGNYQWADWLSYEPLESCSGRAFNEQGPLPEAIAYWNYLLASYWLSDAEMMADMARSTGRPTDKWEKMAREARSYILSHFLTADGLFTTDILNTMQTPALFALRNHLVEGEAKSKMITRLRENFSVHGNCLQTGFLGTSILMGTLTENGMSDIAYELLFQRKNPSWLYSIDQGATTIWERWNSYMVDEGMGPQGMNSFNHYAYGAVCQWIWQSVAGIAADRSNPGFKHIIMSPVPDKRLGHIKAEYKSAAGLITSEWHYEGDTWVWTFSIPKGATATVTLPGESTSKEYKSGRYTIKK